MRRITSSFFMSLDGVVESPHHWHFPYMNDEMMAAVGAGLASSDTMLLGRATYEEWAAHWPNQPSDGGMVDHMNDTPKLVVSNTLDTLSWQNSTLIGREDLASELAEVKQRSGSDISVTGSGTLVRALFELDLIDELRLMIHPIILGEGKRLFEKGSSRKGLELVDSTAFKTGVLKLTYQPARN